MNSVARDEWNRRLGQDPQVKAADIAFRARQAEERLAKQAQRQAEVRANQELLKEKHAEATGEREALEAAAKAAYQACEDTRKVWVIALAQLLMQ
ncbi:hypothetical protein CF326_g9377 [Tilletia indica]|uniref:Uncharacterized protein n=1 Tax=Tilletia indica TaxID=43049 RepID=A0A177SY67_9BASI|nr:hypothetical protein CF326_g9377 [Tilletia indica]KAE8237369.1 hypothetical protein A4X13_0g8816 [Tilletia indica]